MVNAGKLGLFFLLAIFSQIAIGQALPENAKKYAPVLKEELKKFWPELKERSIIAAQVEKESCVTLKSSKCWSPFAELKTDREYGFGFGQITVTKRFNNFDEVKKLDKSLSSWKWENRFDPGLQLRAMVLMDKDIYRKLPAVLEDKMAFMLASYNGGLGGILNDRRLCQGTKGCDPNKWFGNVENTSFKSKIKPPQYGKSFFEINREYPKVILQVKAQKYVSLMDS